MYIKCVCFWQKSKLHNRESPVCQHNLNEPHKPALMTLIYISARHIYDSKLSFFFKIHRPLHLLNSMTTNAYSKLPKSTTNLN